MISIRIDLWLEATKTVTDVSSLKKLKHSNKLLFAAIIISFLDEFRVLS